MTLLAHSALEEMMKAEVPLKDRLIIVPLLEARQIGPASIDLRLGAEFLEKRRLAQGAIDPMSEGSVELHRREDRVVVPFGERLSLHPGQFVLGSTLEFIRLPTSVGGQVVGRSSWGRVGLVVATAVAVQPGFAGCLTLELVNMGGVPIYLHPGLRVAQLLLWRLEGEGNYATEEQKYKSPLGPESTKAAWEREEMKRLSAAAKAMTANEPESPTTPFE